MARPKNASAHRFMFATGIEGSVPVITGPNGRDLRIDEMEKTGHYARWKEDFTLVQELGLEFLRYGPPYHRTHIAPTRYDFTFADETFRELKRLEIKPIVDLCHFGVPDWAGNFQNPDWPELFAAYAGAFARRFPWVRFYTPVNEIYVCATFSAQHGWWNERLRSDRAFVTALQNLVRANLRAEEEILKVQPLALFIQSESSEYFHASGPDAIERAELLNERRFLSLDLCYGRDVCARMYESLIDNGMTRQAYHWFFEHGRAVKRHCIMGNDYYATNEHRVSSDVEITSCGEIHGYEVITKQYYDRYHLPVMHTETNFMDEDRAPAWLEKEWNCMLRLKADGVPIVGFTWYSLIDQVDWDTGLRENNGRVNPLGLFDLDRRIRPVGKAYRDLIGAWRDIIPAESLCFDMEMHSDHR